MNLSIATASADLTIYDEMSISEATPHAAFFGLATSLIFRLWPRWSRWCHQPKDITFRITAKIHQTIRATIKHENLTKHKRGAVWLCCRYLGRSRTTIKHSVLTNHKPRLLVIQGWTWDKITSGFVSNWGLFPGFPMSFPISSSDPRCKNQPPFAARLFSCFWPRGADHMGVIPCCNMGMGQYL